MLFLGCNVEWLVMIVLGETGVVPNDGDADSIDNNGSGIVVGDDDDVHNDDCDDNDSSDVAADDSSDSCNVVGDLNEKLVLIVFME